MTAPVTRRISQDSAGTGGKALTMDCFKPLVERSAYRCVYVNLFYFFNQELISVRKSLSFLQMTVHKTYFSVLGTVPEYQPHALKPIKQHGCSGHRPLSPHVQETHLSQPSHQSCAHQCPREQQSSTSSSS